MNILNRKLGLLENLFEILHDLGGMIDVNVARIEGELTPDILQQALDLLQKLHPMLQVHIVNLEDGNYFQSAETTKIPLQVIDKQSDNQWINIAEEELHKKFPGGTNPLCRVTFIRAPQNKDISISEIVVTFHHAIADGLSCMYFIDKLLSYCQQITDGEDISEVVTMQILPPIEDMLDSSIINSNNLEVSEEKLNQEALTPQLIIEAEAPANDRRTCIVPRILSQEMTMMLIDSCKQEQTTVHGALCAAMLFSASQQCPTNYPINLSCSSNVNLRKYCQPEINKKYLACLVSRISENHSLDKNALFWNLARECKSKIHKSIEIGVPVKLICSDSLRNFNHDVVSKVAEYQMGRDMTVHVSNLGKINIPENYGKLKLKELYFSAGQQIIGSCFWIGVVTFQGKLFCTFAHVFPLISDKTAEWFANSVMNTLHQACLARNFSLRDSS
jgi:NRPS condensation-like uncharacterized protein